MLERDHPPHTFFYDKENGTCRGSSIEKKLLFECEGAIVFVTRHNFEQKWCKKEVRRAKGEHARRASAIT